MGPSLLGTAEYMRAQLRDHPGRTLGWFTDLARMALLEAGWGRTFGDLPGVPTRVADGGADLACVVEGCIEVRWSDFDGAGGYRALFRQARDVIAAECARRRARNDHVTVRVGTVAYPDDLRLPVPALEWRAAAATLLNVMHRAVGDVHAADVELSDALRDAHRIAVSAHARDSDTPGWGEPWTVLTLEDVEFPPGVLKPVCAFYAQGLACELRTLTLAYPDGRRYNLWPVTLFARVQVEGDRAGLLRFFGGAQTSPPYDHAEELRHAGEPLPAADVRRVAPEYADFLYDLAQVGIPQH